MFKKIAYEELNLIIEFIKLFPLMYIVFRFKTKPKKQIVIYSAAAIILTAVLSTIKSIADIPISAYICLVFTILILSGKRKIVYSVITYLGICMLDMLLASFMMLVMGYRYEVLSDSDKLHFIANSASIPMIGIIIGITLAVRRSQGYKLNGKISIAYLIFILIGEISISIFITAFQLAERSDPILGIGLCTSGIAFLILDAVMMINYISRVHYKSTSEINEKLLKIQEKYYSMLLEKDRDTVKFRHDMNSHINCMYMLFKDGKYDELDAYFEKFGAALSELRPSIQTGNDLLNAILNDIALKYPEVQLEIEGRIPGETCLSNMDICTIFSNLLDNAFNAAEKSMDKLVLISFKFIGGNFYCTIKNTVSKKINVINNELETEKNDKQNHGFGTLNARNCAERNNGEIIYSCDEHFFYAELIFPKISDI